MQLKLTMLIAVAACCCTAVPIAYNDGTLVRPSPINPDIPMDPKPVEKITIITDPKEIAKYKREISDEAAAAEHLITAPTTVPPSQTHTEQSSETGQHSHHREKRDSIALPVSQEQIAVIVPTKESTAVATLDSTSHISTTAAPIPLIYRDQHKQPILADSTLHHETSAATVAGAVATTDNEQITKAPIPKPQTVRAPLPTLPLHHDQGYQRPQTLPYYEHHEPKIEIQSSVVARRDIPVPLVPKYHHPEESPKAEDKQHETEASKEDKSSEEQNASTTTKKPEKRTSVEHPDNVQVEDLNESHHYHQQKQIPNYSSSSTTTEHPIFRQRPIPVAELFAKTKTTAAPEQMHQHEN